MRVSGREHPSPQVLKIRVRHDAFHQPFGETPAPVRIEDEDIGDVGKRRAVGDYAGKPDFPKCAYGKHVDILGYTGVVVEIVQGSLKIQSATGTTRSYNSEVLKKLYGKG